MSEFVNYLHEVFALSGPIQARRMFGGHGLFRDGLMFGLVADDVLYLKADAQSSTLFESRGLTPFAFVAKSKTPKVTRQSTKSPTKKEPRR